MSNPIRSLAGTYGCASAQDTRALGHRLGELAPRGLVVALHGPLGAGKTEFVKGLASGLGCGEVVSSPTFAIAHEYSDGRLPLYHLDFYRLESPEEVVTIGFEELAGDGIVAVEWAGKFPEFFPPGTLQVHLAILESGAREVIIR